MISKLTGLLAYARPHRPSILGLLLATLLAAALTALQPWPIKWLVDLLAQEENDAALRTMGLSRHALVGLIAIAGVLLFLLQGAVDALLSWGWTVIGRRMVYSLATDLFARLQCRSLLYHSRTAVGETVTCINWDCWALYRLFDAALMKPAYAALSIALMLFLMGRVDGFLTLITALIAPTAIAASLFAGRGLRQSSEAQRRLESDLRSHVQRTLDGIAVVQSFGQESRQQERFVRLSGELLRAQQRSTLLDGMNGFVSGLALSVGAILIVGISAHAAIAGRITIGSVLLFTAYLAALQSQLKNVVAAYPVVQSLAPSIARIDEILHTVPEVADRPAARPLRKVAGHIRFENVCFSYAGTKNVLDDVSFEAEPGQTTALVGPTGAGKSTLVSLIPRFFDPTSGCVLLDGEDLRNLTIASLRAQIAIVLQEPFLFPASVAENIALARPNATSSEIEAAAHAARAHDFIAKLPNGYETLLGERGANLSGGERQRISLARAFLKDAPILVLDEPTSALDAETEALIVDGFRGLSLGRTTFIIAHRLTTIQRADQVLVLEQGAIGERGVAAQLAKAGDLYSRLNALNVIPASSP